MQHSFVKYQHLCLIDLQLHVLVKIV